MRKFFLVSLGSAVVALGLAGCGGSEGDTSGLLPGSSGLPGTSGLPASEKLNNLTDAEKAQACDWAVAKFGGYGMTCNSDWAFMRYPDQASCVADASSPTNTPNCQGTVGQFEACVNSIWKCATFADLKSSPLCAPLTVC
jgi:hypothetical protein